MTLYEMTGNILNLYRLLEDGEIDEQTVNDTIEAMCVADKLEDYCKVIRQFEADAAAYAAEKKRFEEKQKRAEKTIEKMQNAIIKHFAAAGKTEDRCGLFEIKISTSKAANIVNESKIPSEYVKVEQTTKIDKAAIRKVLLGGGSVEGAELKINQSVKIK
jgi:hypothetical protein